MSLIDDKQLIGITAEHRAVAAFFLQDPELGETVEQWIIAELLGLPATPDLVKKFKELKLRAERKHALERDEHEAYGGIGA